MENFTIIHSVKSVHISSYSGTYFPAFGLNTDQNNSIYAHVFTQWLPQFLLVLVQLLKLKVFQKTIIITTK